ncbi:MAG TPA: heavy metal-binding domain-containing protein [Thermoanaerobaculia bacterium]|nr:heavy metal-binding domain-containing protein [Thermoanaerobaculia bacterium]
MPATGESPTDTAALTVANDHENSRPADELEHEHPDPTAERATTVRPAGAHEHGAGDAIPPGGLWNQPGIPISGGPTLHLQQPASRSKASRTTAHAEHATPGGDVWVCPMHPEVVSDEPGACPKCGMDLEKEKEAP